MSFELVPGYVFTDTDEKMEMLPGTLHLTDCLSQCRLNRTCQSINFETGLCVLFSSSSQQAPQALTASQFPVFTIYAQKICLMGECAAPQRTTPSEPSSGSRSSLLSGLTFHFHRAFFADNG